MKWVLLSCGHGCWVPWLEAHVGRDVMCPGPGTQNEAGNFGCAAVAQQILEVVPRIWPKTKRVAA